MILSWPTARPRPTLRLPVARGSWSPQPAPLPNSIEAEGGDESLIWSRIFAKGNTIVELRQRWWIRVFLAFIFAPEIHPMSIVAEGNYGHGRRAQGRVSLVRPEATAAADGNCVGLCKWEISSMDVFSRTETQDLALIAFLMWTWTHSRGIRPSRRQ